MLFLLRNSAARRAKHQVAEWSKGKAAACNTALCRFESGFRLYVPVVQRKGTGLLSPLMLVRVQPGTLRPRLLMVGNLVLTQEMHGSIPAEVTTPPWSKGRAPVYETGFMQVRVLPGVPSLHCRMQSQVSEAC